MALDRGMQELVQSDLRVPFGGVKEAGCGRERSEADIQEYVNHHTVCRQRPEPNDDEQMTIE